MTEEFLINIFIPSPSILTCIKPCRDRCYKLLYMFLNYTFPFLLNLRFENLHIIFTIFQLMKIPIELIDLIFQGDPDMLNRV